MALENVGAGESPADRDRPATSLGDDDWQLPWRGDAAGLGRDGFRGTGVPVFVAGRAPREGGSVSFRIDPWFGVIGFIP